MNFKLEILEWHIISTKIYIQELNLLINYALIINMQKTLLFKLYIGLIKKNLK
jgi:hypothetical protein